MSIVLHNEDCKAIKITERDKVCIVTDPPFNIGYRYNSYKDKMDEDEYYNMLTNLLAGGGKCSCALS